MCVLFLVQRFFRIRKYPWWNALARKPIAYTTREAPFTRYGDLHSRLAEVEKRKHKPETLVGTQVVTPEGALYEDDPARPHENPR